jgi:hypothetical protein
MAFTAIPNTPAITLQPTGPAGPTSLNPVYSATDPTNGNYFTATGRDLVTFYCYPTTTAPAWLATSNYTVGAVVNFAGENASITNVAIATNVATLTAINAFTVGEVVNLSGLTTATFLNGQVVTVTGSTGTTFTFTFAHADYPSAADTGSVTNTAGAFIATAASGPNNGGARNPHTPAYWSAYVDADATVTLYSAPDMCTGRKSDVDGYDVPLGAGSVEFLVLPSSVFTQANGQVQFLTSSNLIYVYVRSL